LHRFYNPILDNPDYVPEGLADEVKRVEGLLATARVDLTQTLCDTAPMVEEVAIKFGARPMRAQSMDCTGGVNAVFLSTRASVLSALKVGVPTLDALFSMATGVYTEPRTSTSALDLYRHLGLSVALAGGVSLGDDERNLQMLKELCTQQGNKVCAHQMMGFYNAIEERTNPGGIVSRTISSLVLAALAAIVNLLAGLVVAATPFAIGATKIVALMLGIIGVFMLLIPNRLTTAVEWMIGPITWVNLWHALFLIWWKISEFLDKMYDAFVFSSAIPDGGLGAASIMKLLSASGYLAVAVFAYHIVFTRASGGAILLAGSIAGTQRLAAKVVKTLSIIHRDLGLGRRGGGNAPSVESSSKSGGAATKVSANPPRRR
jgi:hypothetical protein